MCIRDSTSVLSQYVLYDYLTHNDYDGHIAEIRALYESQFKTMLDAMAAVSYTHLDVYKRQMRHSMPSTMPRPARRIGTMPS